MHPVAWRPLSALALAFASLQVVFAGRYGYHRDELYFIAIGGHPAFGYVDQPPLVPLLAHAMDAIGGHHLTVLRLPSALAGATVVLVTGLIARELGADRRAQAFAAACMAVSGVLLAIGHLMSTTTYDVLAWTVLTWLIIRAIREDGTTWLAVGVTAGIALEIKTLPAFFLFALLAGVLVAGPRHVLASRWLWGGAAIAATLWLPNLWWQAAHDWPQLRLAKSIANGSSGTSQSRWAFVPMQFLITGPPLAPIWVAGLVRIARDKRWRFFAVAYGVLGAVFLATDGKPYYLAGLYPMLFAAAAQPVLAWLAGARRRRAAVGILVGAELVVTGIVVLPVLPPTVLLDTPIVAMNYDAGETIGWPRFVDTLAAAVERAGPRTVVLTGNYGEAGALIHFRPDVRRVYGSQNSMWGLGGPPHDTISAIVVGFREQRLHHWFSRVEAVARIDDGIDVDNDEQGAEVYRCTEPTMSWHTIWQQMRHLS